MDKIQRHDLRPIHQVLLLSHVVNNCNKIQKSTVMLMLYFKMLFRLINIITLFYLLIHFL